MHSLLSVLICDYNPAPEVILSNLTLESRTATTLSVTWSAGYPKCYSFNVSHSTQDGSINVTQPADSDTSHTLTSLQPGTTYRIEVEAVRKGEGADGQMARVMGYFTTKCEGAGHYKMVTFDIDYTAQKKKCQANNVRYVYSISV